MKKMIVLSVLLLAAASLTAQVNDGWLLDDDGWPDQSDFDKFKAQSEQSFDAYRDSINARFAKALEGKWSPFEVEKPVERPRKPEPQTPPEAPKPKPGRKPQEVPQRLPRGDIVPPPLPLPQPRKLPAPQPPSLMNTLALPFYGRDVKLDVPKEDRLATCTLADNGERSVAGFWLSMTNADMGDCIALLLLQQQKLQLNDWAVYDMTRRLTEKLFPDADRQVAATVFLLNQMEYDARIARTQKGLATLLAIDGMVYAAPYITLGGRKYYIFMPNNGQRTLEGNICTYSCTFENAVLKLDMNIVTAPKMAQSESTTPYRFGNILMPVNLNMIDFYRGYPQVEFTVYANAAVDNDFRERVEENFRPMVQGKGTREAVSALLYYMHYGFAYATDGDQFGYEKPFFCEENFYYPKNDCEDRSILFSYLVRHLLGLEVVLLDYPDHIATAVCFPEGNVEGDYYEVDGKRFVVCDPTYIGASIGMTQPAYRTTKAKIIQLRKLK